MEGIKPCPYCGGEVKVIKLVPNANEPKDIYRIECRSCRKLVARGWKFPADTLSDAEERIRQYQDYIRRRLEPHTTTHFRQSYSARDRDRKMAMASRTGSDDEIFEMHDATNRNGHQVDRGGLGDWDV